MKNLNILKKTKTDNGTMVEFEITEEGKVIEHKEQLVPVGFDRLLVPQVGGSALFEYI